MEQEVAMDEMQVKIGRDVETDFDVKRKDIAERFRERRSKTPVEHTEAQLWPVPAGRTAARKITAPATRPAIAAPSARLGGIAGPRPEEKVRFVGPPARPKRGIFDPTPAPKRLLGKIEGKHAEIKPLAEQVDAAHRAMRSQRRTRSVMCHDPSQTDRPCDVRDSRP